MSLAVRLEDCFSVHFCNYMDKYTFCVYIPSIEYFARLTIKNMLQIP